MAPINRVIRNVSLCAAAILAMSVATAVVNAAELDQFQLDGSEQNQAIHSIRNVGQTFTIGTAGTLDSIELSLFERGTGGDLILDILDFSGGDISTAPSLGNVSVAETDLGPFPINLSLESVTATLIDVSSLGIEVDVGDLLAFELTSPRILDPPTNIYAIRTAVFSNLYADGAYFVGSTFINGDAAFKIFVETTVDVGIDIKPGSDKNKINLNSAGVVSVAILSSESFDALEVNEDTIFLASSGVKVAGKSGRGQCHERDVNKDGLDDLVCHVETAEFMIEEGQDTAVLTAETFDGTSIRGEDNIQIVP